MMAANSRLLLLGQFRRLHRSSAGLATAAFVYCLNLPTFSRNLAQYRPYTKPIFTFTMASSSQSRRARVRPMNGTLLGHVSLLPRQTILEVRKSEFGTHRPVAVLKTSVRGQNWPPSAYRSYHFSNGTILATDLRQHFCRCWASVGPYLTSHLGTLECIIRFECALVQFIGAQKVRNSSLTSHI